MSKLENIIYGLNVFKQHNQLDISAQHDIIYAGGEVPEAQAETLKENGWMWDDEFDCWSIFT